MLPSSTKLAPKLLRACSAVLISSARISLGGTTWIESCVANCASLAARFSVSPGRESLAASVASRRIEGQHCQKHRLTRGAPRGQAQHEVTRRISGQQGSKNHGKAQNEPPAPAWSIETYLESRRRLLLQVTQFAQQLRRAGDSLRRIFRQHASHNVIQFRRHLRVKIAHGRWCFMQNAIAGADKAVRLKRVPAGE